MPAGRLADAPASAVLAMVRDGAVTLPVVTLSVYSQDAPAAGTVLVAWVSASMGSLVWCDHEQLGC